MPTITEAVAKVDKDYRDVASMFDTNLNSLDARNKVLKRIRDEFVGVLDGFKSGLKPKLLKLAEAKDDDVKDQAEALKIVITKYGNALNFGGEKDLVEANPAVGDMSYALHSKHLDKMTAAIKSVVSKPSDKKLRKELETLAANWSKAKGEAQKYVIKGTANEVSKNESALVAIKKFQKSGAPYFAKATLDKIALIDKAANPTAAKELAGKLKAVTAALLKESKVAVAAINAEPSLRLQTSCQALHELVTQKAGG